MRLSYNSSTNVVSGFSEVNLGTLIGGAWANSDGRGLLRLASGSLLVGNWQLTSLGVLDQALALVGGGTLSYSGTAFPGQLSMCALSGGGFAAGDTQFGGTQKIEEFSAAAAYVRTIGTLTLSLGGCAETTSTRVFWVDYDALNDADGNIKVSDFSGGAWATTASVTSDALFPGLGDSVFYDVTSHTNGYVYFFPMTLSGSRNKKVLRCSATGTLTDCATIGSDLDTFDNSLNIIQNAKQIPGTDDILFLSETTLKAYRYNTTTNGVTTIGDLAALGLANVNTWGFRGMVIVSQ